MRTAMRGREARAQRESRGRGAGARRRGVGSPPPGWPSLSPEASRSCARRMRRRRTPPGRPQVTLRAVRCGRSSCKAAPPATASTTTPSTPWTAPPGMRSSRTWSAAARRCPTKTDPSSSTGSSRSSARLDAVPARLRGRGGGRQRVRGRRGGRRVPARDLFGVPLARSREHGALRRSPLADAGHRHAGRGAAVAEENVEDLVGYWPAPAERSDTFVDPRRGPAAGG